MKLTPVQSSMLNAVGYDSKAKILQVVFSSGSSFQYFDVPQKAYDELITAESKGTYMANHVINCYQYEQVKTDDKPR